LPLRAGAVCAVPMSMGHDAGAFYATYGQGKEQRLWQK